MSRVAWRLVDLLSRLLEPDEREAVRGDIEEARETAGQALRDLLGLIVRRQATLWTDWRPWLALFAVVAPVGMLLSLVSRSSAEGTAIYSWLYVNNWTWGYLGSPGARHDLASTILSFLLNYFALAGWSWTSGFVLGSLSPKTGWLNAALFCLFAFGGTGSATVGSNPFNAVVFSLTLYSTVLPAILRTVLVVLPTFWGVRKGRQAPALPLSQAIVSAALIGVLTARAFPGLARTTIFLGTRVVRIPVQASWMLELLALAVVWPAAYLVFTAGWRRWHGETTAS